MVRKKSVTVQPGQEWADALKSNRPDLCEFGLNYAVECLIADACEMPRPPSPSARIKQGAENRGRAISKAAKKR